jgi:hypothetical protein
MSHVRVDDEMHRRVMSAVSKALDEKENKGAEAASPAHVSKIERTEDSAPVRRKAKVSVIRIISIAACVFLVAGGAVMFAKSFFSKSAKTESTQMAAATSVAGDVNYEIDAALGGGAQGVNSNKKTTSRIEAGGNQSETEAAAKEETTVEDEKDNAAVGATRAQTVAPENKAATGDYRNLMPFKVKTAGSSTYGENNITAKVYTGENGEKAVVFSAKEGTDLVKAYYPNFKGIPALLQTEGGQVFYGIDTSVGAKQQVGTTGPYDAVTWTKNGTAYMLAFSKKTDVMVLISIMEKI